MARMKSLLIAGLAILGLTAVSKPAFAFKPYKITLTCNAVSGDVITGSVAYLTLCDASSSSCSGSSGFACPTLPSCDSSTTVSETDTCTAPFKVGGFMVQVGATDYLATGFTATGGFGGGGIIYPLPGKGYSVSINTASDGGNSNDTVQFEIK
jgi:hypothetical protein